MLQEGAGVHHQEVEVEVGVQHRVEQVEVGVQHKAEEEEVVDPLQKQGEVEEEVEAQHHNLLVEVEVEVAEEGGQPLLDHQEVEEEVGEVGEWKRQGGWMVGKQKQ